MRTLLPILNTVEYGLPFSDEEKSELVAIRDYGVDRLEMRESSFPKNSAHKTTEFFVGVSEIRKICFLIIKCSSNSSLSTIHRIWPHYFYVMQTESLKSGKILSVEEYFSITEITRIFNLNNHPSNKEAHEEPITHIKVEGEVIT